MKTKQNTDTFNILKRVQLATAAVDVLFSTHRLELRSFFEINDRQPLKFHIRFVQFNESNKFRLKKNWKHYFTPQSNKTWMFKKIIWESTVQLCSLLFISLFQFSGAATLNVYENIKH